MAVATTGAQGPAVAGFTSADTFHLVVESAVLNAQEVGECCRRRGCIRSSWRRGGKPVWWRIRRLRAAKRRPSAGPWRRRNSELEGELRRKEKALAEAATLLVLHKKVRVLLGEPGDGNWTSGATDGDALIREAGAAGARLEAACAVLDVSPRTWQRWQAEGGVKVDGRHAAAQARTPANALSPAERQHLLGVANSPSLPASHRGQISLPDWPTGASIWPRKPRSYRVLRAPTNAPTAARPRRPATIARRLGSPPAPISSGVGISPYLALPPWPAVFLP